MVNARIAINMMMMFLKIMMENWKASSWLFQKANICMIAGNATPMLDKQKAPTNEMKISKFGTAAAKKTVDKQYRYRYPLVYAFEILSIGT